LGAIIDDGEDTEAAAVGELKGEESARPIVDKVVAERTTEAVAQAFFGLLQQVDKPIDCSKADL